MIEYTATVANEDPIVFKRHMDEHIEEANGLRLHVEIHYTTDIQHHGKVLQNVLIIGRRRTTNE